MGYHTNHLPNFNHFPETHQIQFLHSKCQTHETLGSIPQTMSKPQHLGRKTVYHTRFLINGRLRAKPTDTSQSSFGGFKNLLVRIKRAPRGNAHTSSDGRCRQNGTESRLITRLPNPGFVKYCFYFLALCLVPFNSFHCRSCSKMISSLSHMKRN